MKQALLFFSTVLIWGSTFFAIKLQLNQVEVLISIFYRFLIASILLLIFCWFKKIPLKFTLKEHLFFLLLGWFLFGFNYWLIYIAEQSLTSGIVAVVFSSIIFFNMINGFIFLKNKIFAEVFIGAVFGLIGIGLIFLPEIQTFSFEDGALAGFFISILGVYFASLGNIIAERNSRHQINVWQNNTMGMLYSSLSLFVLCVLLGKEFSFEYSFTYGFSLLYLAILGSIIAFFCYLSLINTIGTNKAGYIITLTPLVALSLSYFFEDYEFNSINIIGVLLVLIGLFLVLYKKSKTIKNN